LLGTALTLSAAYSGIINYRSFEANLEYMFRNFGFYLPDAEYLKDPEGLVKYLVSEWRSRGARSAVV
jgi:hypothetical protein